MRGEDSGGAAANPHTIAGMVMASLAAMTHGAAVVFPSASFDPAATLAAVQQERCTALYGVPTRFIGVLDAWRRAGADPAAVASLRTGIMGALECWYSNAV